MNINEINNAWIAAGQKVSDLNAQISNALLDDSFKAEAFKALKEERDNQAARRDELKNELDEMRAQEVLSMKDKDVTPLTAEEKNIEDKFVTEFKNMVRGKDFKNLVSSSDGNEGSDDEANAGLTIPKDIQTTIRTLIRQYDSLQDFVNVEAVSTQTGSRVIEKMSDITPLQELDDEDGVIGATDEPKLTLIKYAIKRYAGITTATNSLLKDTAENILAWLTDWIAKKVVATRNAKIIEVLGTPAKKPTITKFDDVMDLSLLGVDPALDATSIFITNKSGFAVLAKVKDAMGNYLMTRDPTNPRVRLIDGKVVKVVADRALPDVGGSHPIYYGDFKEGITLFDREHLSLLSTNIGGGGFERDQTKIRVIDRFDVKAMDNEAWVAGSFKTIADQSANFAASASAQA